MQRFACLLCLAFAIAPVSAQDAKIRAKVVAPFLDDLTLSVARIDFSRIDADQVLKHLEKLHADAKTLESLRLLLPSYLGEFERLKVREIYAIRSLAFTSLVEDELIIIPLGPDSDGRTIKAILDGHEGVQTVLRKDTLLVGNKRVLEKAQTIEPAKRLELEAGFAIARPAAIQMVFMPSPLMRRSIIELMPDMPKDWGGWPTAKLSRAFESGLIELDVSPRLEARLTIQSADAACARELSEFLTSLIRRLKESRVIEERVSDPRILDLFLPTVKDNRLVVTLDEKALQSWLPHTGIAGIKPLAPKKKEPTPSEATLNNMRQIAVAMHSYHDVHKSLPMHARYSKDGKPLLSWRVLILPYIEQEPLYKSFRLDEPWDSPHNKRLIQSMPDLYRSPLQKKDEPGKTAYLVPFGKDTIFDGPRKSQLHKITDGASNTLMLLEVKDEHAVIWTKPDDFDIAQKDPLSSLAFVENRFHVLFADGATRTIPRTITVETLRALMTRNGGESLDLPD